MLMLRRPHHAPCERKATDLVFPEASHRNSRMSAPCFFGGHQFCHWNHPHSSSRPLWTTLLCNARYGAISPDVLHLPSMHRNTVRLIRSPFGNADCRLSLLPFHVSAPDLLSPTKAVDLHEQDLRSLAQGVRPCLAQMAQAS